jgi:plasmid stabilization system protein ParE
VRYTATARRELSNGIEYLAQHAPSVVGAFADAIERALKDVAEFPFSAQETEKQGVRRKYVRRFHYCIFYVIADDEVVVLHIRHAAQRLPWEKSNGVKPS